jgi:hypothetical protein
VPDYLILPFGRAKKEDLQRIMLSAVCADGLHFSTDVSVISIRKSEKQPLCLGDFERHFGPIPPELTDNDPAILDHMCAVLKSHSPNPTHSETLFLNLYFETLKAFREGNWDILIPAGLEPWETDYKSRDDLWRALVPIPQL